MTPTLNDAARADAEPHWCRECRTMQGADEHPHDAETCPGLDPELRPGEYLGEADYRCIDGAWFNVRPVLSRNSEGVRTWVTV